MLYKDKGAFESKKFKMTLATLISVALTPVLYSYLGPVAPSIADQVSPWAASAIMGFVGGAYVVIQGWIDKTLAANKSG